MQITEDKAIGDYLIYGYGKGFVTVNDQTLTQSFIISPATLMPMWAAHSIEDLNAETLNPLLTTDSQVSLIILGTGERVRFPKAVLLAPFYERGIGVEIMSTAAACRTYTLLAAEGRRFLSGMIL